MANEFVPATLATFMTLMAGYSVTGLGSGRTVSITYENVASKSFNTTTLQTTETKTSDTLSAHMIDLRDKPGKAGEPAGDVCFVIDTAQLDAESISPTRDDRITVSGDTYLVRSWGECGGGLRHYFMADKVAS